MIIQTVVTAFYDKARTDILIGYHFQRIKDFDAHLPRIFAFWELQLLGKTNHELATPLDAIRAHMPLNIHVGELHRWVKIFKETLAEFEMPDEFRERWLEKLEHFLQVFLRNPQLFSSKG